MTLYRQLYGTNRPWGTDRTIGHRLRKNCSLETVRHSLVHCHDLPVAFDTIATCFVDWSRGVPGIQRMPRPIPHVLGPYRQLPTGHQCTTSPNTCSVQNAPRDVARPARHTVWPPFKRLQWSWLQASDPRRSPVKKRGGTKNDALLRCSRRQAQPQQEPSQSAARCPCGRSSCTAPPPPPPLSPLLLCPSTARPRHPL